MKVLSNIEIAKEVQKELSKQGYDLNFENILNKIDIGRSPKQEKEPVDIQDFIDSFLCELE